MDPNQGVDVSLHSRPGVPMERSPVPVAPRSLTHHQTPRFEVLFEPGREGLTPVFGTSVPPRGLSGILRRAAYKQPDYHVRRWLLLLVADRVDEHEGRLVRAARQPFAWPLVLAGLVGVGLASVAFAGRTRR